MLQLANNTSVYPHFKLFKFIFVSGDSKAAREYFQAIFHYCAGSLCLEHYCPEDLTIRVTTNHDPPRSH